MALILRKENSYDMTQNDNKNLNYALANLH